jgi:ribonuclease E
LALSIVNITSAHPAPHGFNTAPSLNGALTSAVAGNDAAGDAVTAAVSTDAVKPAARLAGVNPAASGLDARASAHFATNPVSTGPAAASAFDYAKAIAAYQAQSIVGVAPGSTAVTPADAGDAANGAVAAPHAASHHVGDTIAGAHQSNATSAAEDNSQAAPHAAGNATAPTDNPAAPAANAPPPGNLLEAGGQANPIAAPTAHAVMSLLKMI